MIRRPRRRSDGDDITDAERLWAMGLPIPDREERGRVRYFTRPARLRFVWEQVHGEPIEEHLRRKWEGKYILGGQILVNVAAVGQLTRSAARALMQGRPFEWD